MAGYGLAHKNTLLLAKDGNEGLEMIFRKKPAAVVDFMLPGMSGIEVCRKIRESGRCPEIKLILFTSDERRETKKEALAAGADAVIVKSPEAKEVVETVVKHLKNDLP